MTATRVHRATVDDVPRAAPLFAAYRAFYGQADDEPLAARFLHDRLSRDESVVLLALGPDDQALGFTQLYPGFSSVSAAPAWVLNDLYVVEQARGAGVATALLDAAERVAADAGAAALSLATARDNLVAQRLYARHGYQLDDAYLHLDKRLPSAG